MCSAKNETSGTHEPGTVDAESTPLVHMENISIRKDRELKKKVIVCGNFDDIPREGSHVHVKITDVLFNNESGECQIDEESVYFRKDFDGRIKVGDADYFIDVDLDRCLQRMSLGETSLLAMVYRNGVGRLMKQVSCRVELLQVSDEDLISDWDRDKLLERAHHHKERGVQLVRARRIADAFRHFSKSFKYVLAMEPYNEDFPMEKVRDMLELRLKLLNNLAHCQLYYQEYEAALQICNKILDLEELNIKAVYRRGVARMGLHDWEGAHRDMSMVLRYEPHNRAAVDKLTIINPKVQKINDNYNSIIKKMFS